MVFAGGHTEVVAASLAESRVDAQTGRGVSLGDTLDVALAESLDTVGAGSGCLVWIEGLTLVDATVGSQHVVGGLGEREGRRGSEEEGGAHFGGCSRVGFSLKEGRC